MRQRDDGDATPFFVFSKRLQAAAVARADADGAVVECDALLGERFPVADGQQLRSVADGTTLPPPEEARTAEVASSGAAAARP